MGTGVRKSLKVLVLKAERSLQVRGRKLGCSTEVVYRWRTLWGWSGETFSEVGCEGREKNFKM